MSYVFPNCCLPEHSFFPESSTVKTFLDLHEAHKLKNQPAVRKYSFLILIYWKSVIPAHHFVCHPDA
ncbi:uncharacterized protein METZ01_LOCUS13735 [marine metagenome]|uniref:Uncharacterized protein n=1 Tax=marine metagenome TaxID=408172 RepID=A0A381P1U7_9ZZZZ